AIIERKTKWPKSLISPSVKRLFALLITLAAKVTNTVPRRRTIAVIKLAVSSAMPIYSNCFAE
ncbi:unnamed protein product, partial [marine sediment metagenome]